MVRLILNIKDTCAQYPLQAEYVLTRPVVNKMEENLEAIRRLKSYLTTLEKYSHVDKILRIDEELDVICIQYDPDDKLILSTPAVADDVYETIRSTIEMLETWEIRQYEELNRQYSILEELHRLGIISIISLRG